MISIAIRAEAYEVDKRAFAEQDGLAIDEENRKLVILNREHATEWFEETQAAFNDKSDEAAGDDDDQPGKRARLARVSAKLIGGRAARLIQAARSWMADNAVPFELAETCLAHTVGNAVVQAYQRSSMLERRRPIMSAWAAYVWGSDADNVVPLMARRGSAQ
jgi:hypothetical protein